MTTERNRKPLDLTARDRATLFDEIRRYLDVVDVFRREGCEPQWTSGAVPDTTRP
jgi:hypothetical protein